MDLSTKFVARPPIPEGAPAATSCQGADLPGTTTNQVTPRVLSPAQLALQAEARQRTDALLRDLWKRKLPIVREQLATLERALETLTAATLTTPLRSNAAMTAHKLAGSLGMFGYHEGTHFARQLESYLDSDEPISQAAFADALQRLTASLDL